MSAKLLNMFGDENPDLQKQIGCMNGIFQMFDPQNLLTPRWLGGHGHRRLPSGNPSLSMSHHRIESEGCSYQIVREKNLNDLKDSQRVSVETSRASFSSSSYSYSFPSVECSRSSHKESYDEKANSEKSFKSSTMLHDSIINRPAQHSPFPETQGMCTPSRQSVSFRDVVKDSIYKESNGSTVIAKNKEEVGTHMVKYGDSPRPLPMSKSTNRPNLTGTNEKPKTSEDIKESRRILAKLQKAPGRSYEDKDPWKSSYEVKDASFFSVPKEASQFLYDERVIFDPHTDPMDNKKYSTRFQELPRLSLDSRQGYRKYSNFDPKSNSVINNIPDTKASRRTCSSLTLQQDLASHKQPASVVAKLMGLDPMPFCSSREDQLQVSKLCSMKESTSLCGTEKISPLLKSLRMPKEKQVQLSCSPMSSLNGYATPRPKTAESVMKPISGSRLPIESAPWRQQNYDQGTHKMKLDSNCHMKQQQETVYGEIERKLKSLEFQQSSKDLRALKHILHSIQAKGLLDTKKDEGQCSEASDSTYSDQTIARYDQNSKTKGRRNSQGHAHVDLMRGDNTLRPLDSPIVIMKPSKSVNRNAIPACSVVNFDGLSTLQKAHSGDTAERQKPSVHNRIAKEQNSKLKSNGNVSQSFISVDEKSSRHSTLNVSQEGHKMFQGSSVTQPLTKENSYCSVTTSGSLSPRLHPKKLDMGKKSCPSVSSSESGKQEKLSTRHVSKSVSRIRAHSEKVRQENKQVRKMSNGKRDPSKYSDKSSLTESNTNVPMHLTECTNSSVEVDSTLIQQCSQNSLDQAVKSIVFVVEDKKSLPGFTEDASAELAAVSLEQPSPVSVLDVSVYRDDQPLSPVSKISDLFTGDDVPSSDTPEGASWETICPTSQLPNNPNCVSSTVSHKKLQSIENLLQKLRRLSSSDDEATETDHIASLCENQNPDHRYVSEILLASGLLLKDLVSVPKDTVPVQFHKSGYPINPDLFLVLEQTHTSISTSFDHPHEIKSKLEKHRRKLLFDTVNEILVQKLDLSITAPVPKTFHQAGKLAFRVPTGRQLLKELCSEIERLQAYSRCTANQEEDSDSLNMILSEDVMSRSEGWTDFCKDLPGLLLGIERSIFKDLIDEVLSGESASSASAVEPGRGHRKSFTRAKAKLPSSAGNC